MCETVTTYNICYYESKICSVTAESAVNSTCLMEFRCNFYFMLVYTFKLVAF